MQISRNDILRSDALDMAIWIEAVADLATARARILHLAERFPAEYFIFHQATASIVANFHFHLTGSRALPTRIVEESLSSS
jgi:hypothetical protein